MNPIVIKAILKFCTTKQLFKLSWSGDSNENFRSSSQAALSQVGGFTLSLSVTERQAGKLGTTVFIVFVLTRPGIEPESTVSVADAFFAEH